MQAPLDRVEPKSLGPKRTNNIVGNAVVLLQNTVF